MNAYAKCKRFHSGQTNSHPAIIHAMQDTGSIYFATLQGYVIFETELYVLDVDPDYTFNTKRRGHCRLELTGTLNIDTNKYNKWGKDKYITVTIIRQHGGYLHIQIDL